MKPFLSWMLIVPGTFVYGQNNFEYYAYQGKYGVVSTSSLEEKVPPVYDGQYNRLNTFLCFKEKGKTFLFSKSTGEKEEYTTPEESDYFYFNNTRYLHVLNDKHSILIEQLSGSKSVLPFRYNSIAAANNGFIIASKEGLSDVYSRDNLKKPHLSSIKGDYSFTDDFMDKKKDILQPLTVIYGDQETYVYDQRFKLIRKYPAASNKTAAIRLMSEDYSIQEDQTDQLLDTPYNQWIPEMRNSDSSVYRYGKSDLSIKVNGDSYISTGMDQGWVTLSITSPESISARFRIDYINKKVLLPLKYQKALGLALR